MTSGSQLITFRVVLRDDESDEQVLSARVRCEGPVRQVNVSVMQSIPGLLSDHDDDRLLDAAAVAIERWCDSQEVSPDDVAGALRGREPSNTVSAGGSPVATLGIPPFTYPDTGSLPGKKGARTIAETPEIPNSESLTEIAQVAQSALVDLVRRSGGRMGIKPGPESIRIGSIDVLAEMFTEWVRFYGDQQDDGVLFQGRPGLWHALDRLVPLQDPNRWDPLRKSITRDLEARGWQRSGGVRGSAWWVPNA